jgi:hypothetical protein
MRTLILSLLCGVLAAQTPVAKPGDLCSLEGRVFNQLTGDALADVKLKLQPATAPANSRMTFTTFSDEQGKFAFAALEPGSYLFSGERTGYLTANYGARRASPNGAPVTLRSGETRAGMNLGLKPQGTITGRVLDTDGSPAGGFVFIYAMKMRYVKGKREPGPPSRVARPDESGEYRLFGLEAGRYIVRAMTMPGGAARPTDRSPRPEDPLQTTYYPSAPDERTAKEIEVAAGSRLTGIDIRATRSPAFPVRGKVVNHSGEELDSYWVGITVAGTSSTMLGRSNVEFLLPRGTYPLVAGGSNSQGEVLSARHVVEVSGPINDLELAIPPAFPVSGRLRVEDGAAKGARITLTPQDPSPLDSRRSRNCNPAEDGAFTCMSVNPDRYFAWVSGLAEGFYVKSILAGKKDVLESGVDLMKKPDEPLEVVVSPHSGSIRGTVTGGEDAAAPGITVVLIPQSAVRRTRAEFYRTATTDEQGKYVLTSVPPGEYRLFAWDDVEDTAWMDAEFLKPLEPRGTAVTVRPDDAQTVDLKPVR